MSDHFSRARALLDAQPECWRKCGVRAVTERKGYQAAAYEARRYSVLCPDYVERSILLGMP